MSHCCDCLSFLPRKIISYTEFWHVAAPGAVVSASDTGEGTGPLALERMAYALVILKFELI